MNIEGLVNEQAAMLEFALRWQPYGGGDSGDILIEFGLTGRDFFTRLLALLDSCSVAANLDPVMRAAITMTCHQRLAHATHRRH